MGIQWASLAAARPFTGRRQLLPELRKLLLPGAEGRQALLGRKALLASLYLGIEEITKRGQL